MSVEFINNFPSVIRKLEDSAAKGSMEVGQTLIDVSNSRYTPYDTGELVDSARLEEAPEGAAIVYDTEYAARLYNGFVNNYKKEKNSQAGPFWIDRAAADNAERILEIIAKGFRGDL